VLFVLSLISDMLLFLSRPILITFMCVSCRVGNFYPHAVLTMVKTPVKTGLGKTPKTHMSWAKLGKTYFLNSKNASSFHILFILVRII